MLFFVLFLGGCVDAKLLPASPGHEKVTLRDLATPVPLPPEALVSAPLAPQRLIVQVMLFEADPMRMSIALDMLDRSMAGLAEASLWRRNGMCLGTVQRDQLPMFIANLPRPVRGRSYTLYNAEVFNPITLVNDVSGRQRVGIVEVDGSIDQRRFYGGEHRILVKMRLPAAEGGAMTLELLPHWYSPLRSLLIRGPQEQLLDGHSFHHLHVHGALRADQVWVATLEPPPQGSGGADEQAEPRSERPIPLGQALMSGQHHGRPVQIMLLIGLEEPPPLKQDFAVAAP